MSAAKKQPRLSAAQRRILLSASIEQERARLARAILGVSRSVARLHAANVVAAGTAAALAVVAGCALGDAERAVALHEDLNVTVDDLRTELLGIGLDAIDWPPETSPAQRPVRRAMVAQRRISA